MIGWEQIVFRIIVGAALGGLVGIEREIRAQAAGLRTHVLVAMGSTLFTLVSLYGFEAFFSETTNQAYRFDPSRVAAQIVVGIGFLGAGAIMRHGATVKGLTTAASLWVVAAIGLAAGAGFWTGAIAVALMLLVVLGGLRYTENLFIKRIYPGGADLIITFDSTTIDNRHFVDQLDEEKIRVREISSIQIKDDATTMELSVGLKRSAPIHEVVERIRKLSGVRMVEWKK